MIYLDASALVTLLAGRAYAAALTDYLAAHQGVPMATSTIGLVETVRTMDQVGTFPNLMSQLTGDLTEIVVTEEVRDAAAHLAVGLRTLDAIHVASAQAIGDHLLSLVTYDKRMRDLACTVGLPTATPGLD